MTRPLPIRDEDIAAYRRDGAAVLRGVLDADALALIEAGCEEAWATRGTRHSLVRDTEGRGETLVEQYPAQHCPSFAGLIASGVPGQIAGRVMGTPSAQLVLDQVFYKTPGRIVPTPWHQDTPFLRVRGFDLVRVWLCCDPSPADLTVEVVRGSHRWNVVFNTRTEAQSELTSELGGTLSHDNIGDDYLPLVPDVARYRDSYDVIGFDVSPGDALVFHGNILHAARGREDWPHPRRAFASLWGGPALRYHRPEGKAFPAPGDAGDIPDGDPIGSHEDAFPVGWRADAAQTIPA